jgi:hypothetical protein
MSQSVEFKRLTLHLKNIFGEIEVELSKFDEFSIAEAGFE